MINKLIKFFWSLIFVRRFSKKNRIIKKFSNILPPCLCIDIGASYFPHSNWKIFILSKNTTWLAVDPNVENINYINNWKYPSKIIAIGDALSKDGKDYNLNIASTDSGSSLLNIEINELHDYRIRKEDFLPVKKKIIKTTKTEKIFQKFSDNQPILLKLDTQGSELEILDGIEDIKKKKIVSIELECGLDNYPIYNEAAKFPEIMNKMKSLGFELLSMKIIHNSFNKSKYMHGLKEIVSHCDAIFTLDRLEIKKRSNDEKIILVGFYISNGFFLEAKKMLEDFPDLKSYFENENYYKKLIDLLSK